MDPQTRCAFSPSSSLQLRARASDQDGKRERTGNEAVQGCKEEERGEEDET